MPMAVVGSDRFFLHFPRRTRVTISLFPPILPNPDDTPLSITNCLMFTIAAALPPEMRGVHAEMPKGFTLWLSITYLNHANISAD